MLLPNIAMICNSMITAPSTKLDIGVLLKWAYKICMCAVLQVVLGAKASHSSTPSNQILTSHPCMPSAGTPHLEMLQHPRSHVSRRTLRPQHGTGCNSVQSCAKHDLSVTERCIVLGTVVCKYIWIPSTMSVLPCSACWLALCM
jgi:hypothetical protein